jgi:protein-S-isoprenylcysteine O-methyltransferase Ste14
MPDERAGAGLRVEWFLRSFAIAAYLLLLLAAFNHWRVNGHPYGLLMLLLTEGFTLVLIVFARRASRRDASPAMVASVVCTSSYFLLFDIADTTHLIPDQVGASVQAAGLALAAVSKAALGRSFGVLPAARGLVTRGPYRLVRHPMYLGYLIGDLAFLLGNASVRNALVILVLVMVQVMRIGREEAVCRAGASAAAWDAYRSSVRFRLIPFVY